jgi:AcrR family transcriptional regulator
MPRGDASAPQVVAAALRLFSAHGVAGTSLQMIADELGVAKAAVYHRFRTKEQIVLAVLAPAFEEFATLLDAAAALPPADRARHLVDALAHHCVTHRSLYAVMLGDVTVAAMRRDTPDQDEIFRRLRDTLAGPAPTPRSTVHAAMFLSGLMAPPVDHDLHTIDDAEVEIAVAQAGYLLLGLDPA